jgi:uncharacterized membrane protein
LLAVIDKSRAEAFSDGVIAVAITLLALDLAVPGPGHGPLAGLLGQKWPNYAAYAVSFLTIGIIWINHRAMFSRLRGVDHTVLVLNLVLLMAVVLLPFSTSLMASYLRSGQGQKLAAVVYGGSFVLMGMAFFGIQLYCMLARPNLLVDGMTPERRRAVLYRNASGLIPYAIATAGALVTPYLTLAICALVAVYYALPGTTID